MRIGKRSNQFEGRVERIAEKFCQMANQVDAVGGDLTNRLKAFETTYNTVEREIRHSSFASKRTGGPASEAAGGSGSGVSASGPIYQLNQHLSSRR